MRIRDTRGQTIALAYVAVVVITVLGGSLLTRSFSTTRASQNEQLHAQVFYMAEGGLEDALSRFAQDIANFAVDANVAQYPVGGGTLVTTFADGSTASSRIAEAEVVPRTVPDDDGISLFVKNYHITTTVQHPASSMAATLHQIISRRIIYTFQHAVFYDQDLEWLPGVDMTLSGRVHSNHDIYIGTHAILTVDSEYLRAVGDIFNRRKDSSQAMAGTVQIKKAGTSPAQYVAMSGLDSDAGNWATESQTRWNGTVKSSDHNVAARAVPVVGSIGAGGYYDSNATVRIVNGTVTEGATTLVPGTNIPPNTVTTSTSFYNNREGKYVKMTEVDLRKLAGWYDCNGDGTEEQCYPNHLPSNGLLFATRNDAPVGQEPGVRLKRGSEISRNSGLTVASEVPVYIQGNYNTVSKKPTAVIADSVNLLSNAWQDANSTVNNVNSGSARTATTTTINTAFIAGVDTTTSGNYNGGLENFPRFHERWTNVTLNITGSFVSLWEPTVAQGDWKYGQQSSNSQYTAPIRNWNYDTSFSSGTSMPPFTPWAVEITKGAWWAD